MVWRYKKQLAQVLPSHVLFMKTCDIGVVVKLKELNFGCTEFMDYWPGRRIEIYTSSNVALWFNDTGPGTLHYADSVSRVPLIRRYIRYLWKKYKGIDGRCDSCLPSGPPSR